MCLHGQALTMSKETRNDGTSQKSSDTPGKIQILPHFWSLASLDELTREKAVFDLIKELQHCQKKAPKTETITSELEYAIQRLVRGLASARKGARQGFATALTQIIMEFPQVTAEHVYQVFTENLSVHGSMKSKEEGNAYFGQIFCHLSLVQALSKRNLTENADAISSSVSRLIPLMKKKSYLKELCGVAIAELISRVDYTSFTKHVLPAISDIVGRGWKNCTTEDIMILHRVDSCFSDQLGKKFFKHSWQLSKILHHKNYANMSRALMESTNFCHPRVHEIWNQILPALICSAHFHLFWREVVEDGLMNSSHERKYLAFQLLVKSVKLVSKEQVPVIFSTGIVKCLINNSAVKGNFLHNAAKACLASLSKEIKDPQIAFIVILQLIDRFGVINFDYVTKTNMVESLISQLDHQALNALFDWLVDVFISGTIPPKEDTSEEEKLLFENLRASEAKACREGALNLMLAIVKRSKEPKVSPLMLTIAKFLFLHGYFTITKTRKKDLLLSRKCNSELEAGTRKICQSRFHSVLSELSGPTVTLTKATNENEKNEEKEHYGLSVLKYAHWLIQHPKYVSLEKTWPYEVTTKLEDTMERLNKLDVKDSEATMTKAFRLLFLYTALQLFDNTEEAFEILEELHICYEKSMMSEKKKKRKSTVEDKEPHWTEVVCEILVGFQAQSSHMMREVTDQVFTLILPHLTKQALELILDAVKGKKAEDLDIDEEQSDDETEEMDDIADTDSKQEADTAEGERNDDDNKQVDEELRAKLKSALEKAGAAAKEEEEAEDDDMESDDDELSDESIDMDAVDDKALNAMDNALGAVFKTRMNAKTGKKKKQEERKSVVHFRLRLLDFLEILIKKSPRSPLVLELPEGLVEVISASTGSEEKALHERAVSLYKKKLCHLNVYPSGNDLDTDYANAKIVSLIGMAEKAQTAEMNTLITLGIVYLIRVLRGSDLELTTSAQSMTPRKRKSEESVKNIVPKNIGCLNINRVGSVLRGCLEKFMTTKKSQVRPTLFAEIISRFPHLGWTMGKDLSRYVSTAVNNFRKVQSWTLLRQLLTRKTEAFQQLLMEISNPLLKSINEVLRWVASSDCKLKAKQLHDFVKLTETLVKEANLCSELWGLIGKEEILENIKTAMKGDVVSRSTQMQAHLRNLSTTITRDTTEPKRIKKRKISGYDSKQKTVINQLKKDTERNCSSTEKPVPASKAVNQECREEDTFMDNATAATTKRVKKSKKHKLES